MQGYWQACSSYCYLYTWKGSVLSCVLHVLIPRLPKSLYLNKKRDGDTMISRELKLINQIAFCSVFIIFSNQSHLQYSRIPLHQQNEIRRWNGILNEISKINAPNATAGKKIKWGDLLPCGVFVFFQNCSFVFIWKCNSITFSIAMGVIKTKWRFFFFSFIYWFVNQFSKLRWFIFLSQSKR